ncbi:MAG: hypothetical protein NTU78_04555, partial [Alphaproteobacteria bacterium]|nr:hypothetical protein [Alphaproteobacteria bacterium]
MIASNNSDTERAKGSLTLDGRTMTFAGGATLATSRGYSGVGQNALATLTLQNGAILNLGGNMV